MTNPSSKPDLKSTVFLPSTEFPMRARLPQKEPEILSLWQKLDFFRALRARRKGKPLFILHDGPPYANGTLHIGHALNKILKDMINRYQSVLGLDANYVPGWDCHGLPIEWKVEEEARADGKNKDDIAIVDFRAQCRAFANHWLGVQREEFQRLGVMGDWDAPYLTMSYEAEAAIAAELGKFLMQGSLYRGARPVMWSAAEKTALAEAEIEYRDRQATTIYVRFPVKQAADADLKDASVIIWTTTPWTIPANRATAYNEAIAYGLYEVVAIAKDSPAHKGEKIIIADELAATIAEECGISSLKRVRAVPAKSLAKLTLAHPLAGKGFDHEVPMLKGDFVTTDQGTGIVHMAPAHGTDDHVLCLAHGIEVPEMVDAEARLMSHVPLFAGMSALKDNEKIADVLASHGGLIGRGNLTHSYPHSWRSHAPLIYRTTPQWFISMQDGEKNGLRQVALAALKKVAFFPAAGQSRLTSMIQTRPDWCISRQRAWGVPIPVFTHKATGEVLRDQRVIDRIVAAFAEDGADAWFTNPPQQFLGNDYKAEDYDQTQDIVDVWFDSGSTHAFVLEPRQKKDMTWPADMYLEGSDQHRGWFHSSLLEACGTRKTAPYKSVLTHGFVLDEKGRKMSKSLGNTTTPQQVIADHGADILRLWVAGSDYYDDLRIGPEIIKQQVDYYRRLRNTLRYLLGSLADFSKAEKLDATAAHKTMPMLERWVLMRLAQLDATIRAHIANHDYHAIFTELHQFCNSDLSAFYFDIRKDLLYCGAAADPARRACRSVMDILFNHLVVWLAPILAFTAEEAWQVYRQERGGNDKGLAESVHFLTFPDVPKSWQDQALANRMASIRATRSQVLAALEEAREAGQIKSALDASVQVHAPKDAQAAFDGLDAADIFITSAAELAITKGDAETHATISQAQGKKCDRCWKILADVTETAGNNLCHRCQTVVATMTG